MAGSTCAVAGTPSCTRPPWLETGALYRHDPLQNKGHARVIDDLPQLLHGLGAGGRVQPLQKGQASGVNIHGEHLRARGLGLIQLGKQGLAIPGLYGGHTPAPGCANGSGSGAEHLRVGAVTGESGNARFDAGGNQNPVVFLVGELVAVVQLHRTHRRSQHRQLTGLAEEVEPGVHRLIVADGIHIHADLLPGRIVGGGHGAGALRAGAGHGCAAGPAVAHRAHLTVGAAAGAGSGEHFLIGHGFIPPFAAFDSSPAVHTVSSGAFPVSFFTVHRLQIWYNGKYYGELCPILPTA